MRAILLFLVAIMLAGCAGTTSRKDVPVRYDLGGASGPWIDPGIGIATIEVRASSWLATPAQLYRLAYADPLQRHSYAESRWAAPPAELVERFLQQRMVFAQPDARGGSCRLALVLDEFEQRFANPTNSEAVLEVRAGLLPRQGDGRLARRVFSLRMPAPSADARGGAVAARATVEALTGEMAEWLAGLARGRAEIASACK